MFWKNGASSPNPNRRWSISRRLALFFSGANFLILVVATGYLYFSLERGIRRDDSAFLAQKIEECLAVLQQHPYSRKTLDREIRIEPEASQFIKYYVRVLNEKGETIAETPGMSRAVPPAAFQSLPTGLATPPNGRPWKAGSGQSFLLMAARAQADAPAAVFRIVQAAVDASADEALLDEYGRKLLAVLLLGIVAAWALGLWIARQGLRPIEEIAQATDQVSAHLLHKRIAARAWPDELSALAASLDRMMERLESSFNRLLQFSADLAHEIRTPINNLRGQTGLALSQARSAEEYRRTLESNLEEYARISRLVENMLFLARADQATTQISPKACNARKSLEKIREFYEALAEDRGIAVRCEGDAALQVDPILFEQAVSNLLSNALNHTPPGGQVRLKVEDQQGCVEVSVADTGCGIAPEHLPKIFDRFYRVDAARSHAPSGYGLGLAIVKSIATLHHGGVEVESRTGEGTRFFLRFPKQQKLTNQAGAGQPGLPEPGQPSELANEQRSG